MMPKYSAKELKQWVEDKWRLTLNKKDSHEFKEAEIEKLNYVHDCIECSFGVRPAPKAITLSRYEIDEMLKKMPKAWFGFLVEEISQPGTEYLIDWLENKGIKVVP